MKKLLLLILLFFFSMFFFYKIRQCSWESCSVRENRELRTLIIGTNTEYEPFSYVDECGVITGLDVELAYAVARKLGLKPQIENMSFNALVPALQTGRVQVIAAGITPTKDRARYVDFARSHVLSDENPLVIVSPASKPITSLDALAGKTIAVNLGYASDYAMTNLECTIPSMTIMRLGSGYINEGFMALNSGRASGFVAAYIAVKPLLKQAHESEYHVEKISQLGESSALVISPHYKDLTEHINQAIEELEVDGTLEALKKQFGII